MGLRKYSGGLFAFWGGKCGYNGLKTIKISLWKLVKLVYALGSVLQIEAERHRGKELTGRYMYHFAEDFADDLGFGAAMPFARWHAKVGAIPYQSDDEIFPPDENGVIEVVARPAYLLNASMWPAIDCKKKAILIGAWCAANNVPFVFVASSEYPSREIHHVFPVVKMGNAWVTADATFPGYRIGQAYPITKAEELQR